MRNLKGLIFNYIYFFLSALILLNLQSFSWFFLFSENVRPLLWVTILTFWSLYRKPHESFVMIYILSFLMTSLSASSLGQILTLQVSLYFCAYFLKSRFYQPGAIFYMWVCGVISSLAPVFYFLFSHLFEVKPIDYFHIFDWVLSALLTTLFALPLHIFFVGIDDRTNMILPTETGRQFG